MAIDFKTLCFHFLYFHTLSLSQAEAAGLKVGDVLTGVSAVFGDAVWSVKEKNIEEIRSLVRCRWVEG